MTSASPQPKQNGSNGKPDVPELPHITNNIIPLSRVLRFYTQEAYKQLSRQIENLANTRTSESDVTRKKKFLELIIALRQDFIKVYTLVKWAQNAKDVSRLIDLLNWFRTQEFYFENLGHGLNGLNHFSGAKLPNSDILTSLEVLVKGRPQLPSYNNIPKPPLSPEKILEVLQDVNLTLTARMALIDNMPPRFYNNYEVRDGRVIITIPNEFQVSITVANDLIIDNEEDAYKSPFFFIDFAFLFGINPETSLITHRDSKIITRLPKASRDKLEIVVNQALLKLSLQGLYEVLHKYAISFKLYLISRQLRDLSVNSKWRGNIQFKYNSSLIIINYWSNHYLSRNWKSFIEIGIDKQYNLNFRWFKNGKYVVDHNIPDINGSPLETEEADDLSVDFILSLIINKHSEMLMSKIHKQYTDSVDEESATFINLHQLLLKLTPRKSTVFSINPLTGFFYFMDPSPVEVQIENKINGQPSEVRNKNFVSEQDMISNVAKNLIQLRLEILSKSLNMKLITTEWIVNDIIRINEYETVKLFNFIVEEESNVYNKIQFYRCRNWPSSWFLINMISGLSSKTYWWVARLKSMKCEWKIQWVQKLEFSSDEDLDYNFFNDLSNSCSNMIVDHMIMEELQARNIGYLKLTDQSALKKFPNMPQVDANEVGSTFSSKHETIVALHNNGNLLPLAISSTTILLVVSLSSADNPSTLNLSAHGTIRGITPSEADTLLKINVVVDAEKETFQIKTTIDLSSKVNEAGDSGPAQLLLNLLFTDIEKMSSLITLLDELKKTKIDVTKNSLSEITFEVDAFYKLFHLKLPDNEHLSLALSTSDDERVHVKLLVRFLNQQISQSPNALVGSIRYLKEFVLVFKSINAIEQSLASKTPFKLQNKLSRLQFDVKFQNLNLVQFVFGVNSHQSTVKKIQKDKITFTVSFKRNKFDKKHRSLFKFSMKDNLNSQNLKFKKLFELIFKSVFDMQKQSQDNPQKAVLLKLHYDFLMETSLLEPLMLRITEDFMTYLKTEP